MNLLESCSSSFEKGIYFFQGYIFDISPKILNIRLPRFEFNRFEQSFPAFFLSFERKKTFAIERIFYRSPRRISLESNNRAHPVSSFPAPRIDPSIFNMIAASDRRGSLLNANRSENYGGIDEFAHERTSEQASGQRARNAV